MNIQGNESISAARSSVWAALNDPSVLQRCIPGCTALERAGENRFEATVGTAIGPIKASFKGSVELSDIQPDRGYSITFTGNAGALGFAKGTARVALADAAATGTLLTYEAQASVGGKIAQLGARMIDTVAAKLTEEFFTDFKRHLTPVESAVAVAEGEHAGGHARTARKVWSIVTWTLAALAIIAVALSLSAGMFR